MTLLAILVIVTFAYCVTIASNTRSYVSLVLASLVLQLLFLGPLAPGYGGLLQACVFGTYVCLNTIYWFLRKSAANMSKGDGQEAFTFRCVFVASPVFVAIFMTTLGNMAVSWVGRTLYP